MRRRSADVVIVVAAIEKLVLLAGAIEKTLGSRGLAMHSSPGKTEITKVTGLLTRSEGF
jgi:hypothetical protein